MEPHSPRNIILIGGAPTTGKSTVADQISKQLHIPWISTDQIREIMRAAARREDLPELFMQDGYTAEKFLVEFSIEKIVRMVMEEGRAVWPGVKAVIESDHVWKDGCVIEGVNILPALVSKDFGDDGDVKAVFLASSDAESTRHVVFTRGLWDDARTYSDDVKDKEVEWSLLFSSKVQEEAQRYGYPCVEVARNKDDASAVLKALGDS